MRCASEESNMKKGYWVVRAVINNKNAYSKYVQLATNIVQKFNGRFIVRGGNQKEVEGSGYDRTVVVEFNSYNDALACYESPEYQSALIHVKNSSKRLFCVVEES